mgnify:CR=1 FL=1
MFSKLMGKIVAKKPEQHKSHLGINNTPYDHMGEQGVRDLANRFYDIMETDPAAKELLAIHPLPLDKIREKFFQFLSGWTGGPDLFVEQYGHPRLRARHLPFPVDKTLRDQWMYCMNKALDSEIDSLIVREHLRNAFAQMATHMINKD